MRLNPPTPSWDPNNSGTVFQLNGKWYKIIYVDGVITERWVSVDDKVTWEPVTESPY